MDNTNGSNALDAKRGFRRGRQVDVKKVRN